MIVALGAADVGIAGIPSIFLVIVILLPVQYAFAYYASLISYDTTLLVTKRVHLMSEIITTIKLIKFYAWERYYLDKIGKRRLEEMSMMKRGLALKISILVLVFIAPTIAAFVSLITYFYLNASVFDAATVFSLISLLNTLRYPLLLLPLAVRSTTAATNSIKKTPRFL